MIDELAAPLENENWDELRARFGRVLGLEAPVPPAVMRRATMDSAFAHRLLASRGYPAFLDHLLRDPRNIAYDVADAPAGEHSTLELTAGAARALLEWGRGGFTQVEPEVFERRMSACGACPNLREAPDRLAYRVKLGRKEDMRVCGLCGCVAARKARLPGEACPAAHPTLPGLTRWSEPIPAARARPAAEGAREPAALSA